MPGYFRRFLACWPLGLFVYGSGCSSQPECDSSETRSAVLQFILEDRNNPLLDYAARNSNSKSVESTKPLYQLGQRMVTASTTRDKRTLKCSGALSVAVGDPQGNEGSQFHGSAIIRRQAFRFGRAVSILELLLRFRSRSTKPDGENARLPYGQGAVCR